MDSGSLKSPCLTPLLILIFSLSLCKCTVTELSVYMSFRISMYTSSIPCSCNDVNTNQSKKLTVPTISGFHFWQLDYLCHRVLCDPLSGIPHRDINRSFCARYLFIYYVIFTQEYPISVQHCSLWSLAIFFFFPLTPPPRPLPTHHIILYSLIISIYTCQHILKLPGSPLIPVSILV